MSRFCKEMNITSRLSLMVRVNVVLNRTVVVTVNNNSPIQDYVHPDHQTQPTFEMTPGFKPFTDEYHFT